MPAPSLPGVQPGAHAHPRPPPPACSPLAAPSRIRSASRAQVSESFDVPLAELVSLNSQIKNPEEVLEGQVIKIPW